MKKKVWTIIIILAVLAVAIHLDSVRYSRTEDRKPLSEMIVATYDADKLRVNPDAETMVIVQANTMEANTTGLLFAYTRTPGEDGTMGPWNDRIIGIPVRLGRGGLEKDAGGRDMTPRGLYMLEKPCGSGIRQEGFPESYGQMPAGPPEHEYRLRIGRPAENGAAEVYLQCYDAKAESTGGDIAADAETLRQILCLYKEGKTVILIEEKGLFSQYY